MEERMINNAAPADCTGNCHTCHSSCAPDDKPRKPSFFDRMEHISGVLDDVGDDEILRILHETVDEWEANDKNV